MRGVVVFTTLREAELNGFKFYEQSKEGTIYVHRTNPKSGKLEFAVVKNGR
jgi:hypothetical protein